MPILVAASTASGDGHGGSPQLADTDCVLNVEHMVTGAQRIGAARHGGADQVRPARLDPVASGGAAEVPRRDVRLAGRDAARRLTSPADGASATRLRVERARTTAAEVVPNHRERLYAGSVSTPTVLPWGHALVMRGQVRTLRARDPRDPDAAPRPVDGTVPLRRSGLGGPVTATVEDAALFVYPWEHYPYWADLAGRGVARLRRSARTSRPRAVGDRGAPRRHVRLGWRRGAGEPPGPRGPSSRPARYRCRSRAAAPDSSCGC